jgi:hypothetical protein
MEGGIFYTDTSTENTDVTSAVVLVFAFIIGAIGTVLAILG